MIAVDPVVAALALVGVFVLGVAVGVFLALLWATRLVRGGRE